MQKSDAQVFSMKKFLTKGKKAPSGPGVHIPQVRRGAGANQGKRKSSDLNSGFYGSKNYDPKLWD